MSRERYDDVTDERKGANTMITAAPDFSDIKAQTVGVSGGHLPPGRECRHRVAIVVVVVVAAP